MSRTLILAATRRLAVLLSLLLTGCASSPPPRLWVNDDGQVRRCAATSWGWGLAGVAAAAGAQKANVECAEDLRRLGFVPLPAVRVGLFIKGHPPQVERIEPGSPAAASGIQLGDTVLDVDGYPVTGFASFVNALNTKQPGETVTIRAERNSTPMLFSVGVVAR